MDWACEELMEVLRRGSKMGFNSLVYRSGLARRMVHNHLKHLVDEGLVLKEAVRQGRGRPTIPYFIPRQVALASKDVVVVSLTFQRLRSICRFEKGGYCKQSRKPCIPENCLNIKEKGIKSILV